MKFTEFTLNGSLLEGIASAGYVECTPVQEQVLQNSLEGRDLYVQSQTGTGKTAAFLVSVIQELLTREGASGKKALIMVPTRELAVQVEEEAGKLISKTDLTAASFYGGVGYDRQVAALKKGVDIIIGTPGRVIDLHEGGQMSFEQVAFLVIDEADRMFDMGFYPDLRRLIKVLPQSEKRQTMLFSATLNSYVKNLAWEYTRNPAEITIDAQNVTVDEIDQLLLHVSSDDKMRLLLGIMQKESPQSLIIFCNTKKSCEIVAKRLRLNGFQSEYIIGDLPQSKRLNIMEKFKAGSINCLVATDVAARGIDVNDLQMVINYDLPNEAENYVHRIGRTARAGKSGKAYTFCSEQDVYSLPAIERYVGKSIPSSVADESLLAEDKSAGQYIKLNSYHEDYNDKSEFGRRRQAEHEAHRRGTKGRGRYSSRNEKKASEYRRDRRVFSAEEEDRLASMSTEERMKLYQEKYAGGSERNSGRKGKGGKNRSQYSKNQNYSKAKGRHSVQNAKPQSVPKNSKSRTSTQKVGLFGKIKSLFSKKK